MFYGSLTGFGSGSAVPQNTNVKLLLHMEGSDEGTTFTDSSSFGNTMTARGNAKTDSAQYKFGSTSAFYDGSGDSLDCPHSSEFDPGSGDFGMDFWVRPSGSITFWPVAAWDDGNISWGVTWTLADTNLIKFRVSADGSTNTEVSQTSAEVLNEWHHYEINRTGGSVYHFKDGTQIGSEGSNSTDTNVGTTVISIGSKSGSGQPECLTGWLDEVRFWVGEAGHTSNFTVKTAAYDGTEAIAY